MTKWNYKNLVFIIISFLPVVSVMGLIFFFSSQNGQQSANTSGEITRFIINIFVSNYDSLDSIKQTQILNAAHHIIRKFAHFSEFGMLGFFMILHIKAVLRFKCKKMRFDFLLSITLGVLYAVSDEVHQIFSNARGPSIIDVLIDSSGVVAGTLLILLILSVIKLCRNKKGDKNAVHQCYNK